MGELLEKGTFIYNYWYGLPSDLKKVDAVYYRKKNDPRIIFFVGKF